VTDTERARLRAGMPGLKHRAKTLVDLAESARFYVQRPQALTPKAAKMLDEAARERLSRLHDTLAEVSDWREEALESLVRERADAEGVKLGKLAQPLRAALTGTTVSPGIFEVMAALGPDEVLARLAAPPATIAEA
jgi:glutamyl-tRNA synthetase